MAKSKYRFGDDYLLAYARKIFKISYKSGGKALKMIVLPRKHRDAQQWAYPDTSRPE